MLEKTDREGSGAPMETPRLEGKSEMAAAQAIDLDAMNDEEIMELLTAALDRLEPQRLSEVISAVQAKRQAKEEEIKTALLTEFRQRAQEAGVSLEALFPSGARRRRSDAGQILAPKYKGPNGETWSGRGRQPNWLTALEASGHDKEEFRVKEE